jgi:hypothetical protein
MGIFLVQTVNTLNEKGLRYKAIEKDGLAVFQFGIVVPDAANGKVSREVIEVTPKPKGITISLMGKEKILDGEGFGGFVENVLRLKALQEDESKIIAGLCA